MVTECLQRVRHYVWYRATRTHKIQFLPSRGSRPVNWARYKNRGEEIQEWRGGDTKPDRKGIPDMWELSLRDKDESIWQKGKGVPGRGAHKPKDVEDQKSRKYLRRWLIPWAAINKSSGSKTKAWCSSPPVTKQDSAKGLSPTENYWSHFFSQFPKDGTKLPPC